MDKFDGGPGNWSALLLILAVVGGIAATQVSQQATPPPQEVKSSAFAAPGNAPEVSDAASILTRLLGMRGPTQAADLKSVPLRDLLAQARASALARNMSVEFLIATLPDYVDSSSGWSFDGTLDAVQRAAGAAGYVLDRFYLPDWVPGSDGRELAMGQRHEAEPGLVLFRKVDPKAATTEILAVFIVTETPTAGVHEAAFLTAADAIAAWYEAGPQPDETALRVLGPTFSGSALSLRLAIKTFLDRGSRWPETVRMLSGTATNRSNQQLLTFSWQPNDPRSARKPVQVSFAAAVRADDVMLKALHDHLFEINPQWKDGAGVVLLVESNTAYGRGFVAGQNEQVGEATTNAAASGHPFPKALNIQFPIHISRLRAEAQRGQSSQPGASGIDAGRMLRDASPATDHLPSMTPQTTVATIDLLVASILSTVRREEYPAIGIFATDKRDHLFLAERIVREVPNALLFTTEADLIYIHPQFRSFVRGAIVASTYPLFNATQSLTSPHLAGVTRQQFSTMGAQGTYNAVLKLLGRDELLLDYLPPGCLVHDGNKRWRVLPDPPSCHYPPVWISVAGRDGLWPIDRHVGERSAGAAESYTAPIDAQLMHGGPGADSSTGVSRPAATSPPSDESNALLHIATWMKAAFVVLLLSLVVHMVAYLAELHSTQFGGSGAWMLAQRWRPMAALSALCERLTLRTRSLPGARILHVDHDAVEQPLAPEHRSFLLIAFAIVWFASIWAMRLFTIWLRDTNVAAPIGSPGQQSAAPYAWYLLYGGILAILVIESCLSILLRRAAVPRGWFAGAVVTVVALFIAFQAGLSLAGFIGSETWADPVSAKLLFARTANPGNWVSPGAPLLALLGVLYLWTLWNIRQLVTGGSMYRRSSELSQLLTGREPRLTDEVGDIMVSPWRRQDWRCLAIPFGLLVLFALYVPRWYTPDGLSFDRFLWWGSLLTVFLIAHSLAMTVHLWLLVRRILRHLWAHPIAAAFSEVAKEPFNWQLSLTPPQAIELKPMARKARTLRLLLQRVIAGPGSVEISAIAGGRGEPRFVSASTPAALAEVAVAGSLSGVAAVVGNVLSSESLGFVASPQGTEASGRGGPQAERRRSSSSLPVPFADLGQGSDSRDAATIVASALQVRQQDAISLCETVGAELPDALDEEMQGDSKRPYFKSPTWHTLVRLSDGLVPVLRHGFWHRGSAASGPALRRWYQDAEVLVGLQAAFVLRDLLARLVSGMTVTIVGAVLALASHLFYSFPGRAAMLAFDWILLALATMAAAVMLLRLERDPVLNLLWSKTSGRLIWTGGFVYRLGAYGAIPIITLFAWQFPEVGGVLFSWLEPLQKAIL